MKKINIAIIAGLVLLVVLSACTPKVEETAPKLTSNEDHCIGANGVWVQEANECEGLSQPQCEELGGTFNECASACRNDPTAEMCTMQCVIVCSFDS